MIFADKTKCIYVREVLNLQCLAGPQDFSRGVKLVTLSNDFEKLIDRKITRLHPRCSDKQYWIIAEEPHSDSDLKDGERHGGLRFLPIAMLITISPYLKFGPSVFINIFEGNINSIMVAYDELNSIIDYIHPNDFVYIDNEKINELRKIFVELVQSSSSEILIVPRDRFVRACLDKREDDGIIDISIALESLYGGNKDNIGRCGASFVGITAHDRERIYVDLAALSWARNKILHEVVVAPSVMVEDGRTLDAKQILNSGFLHCSQSIKKILQNHIWQGKTKRDVLHYYKGLARPFKSDFDNYNKRYKSITRQRNP